MDKISLDFDLDSLNTLNNYITKIGAANKEVLPNTSNAFHQSAQYIQNVWSNYLYGNDKLDGIDALEKPLKPKDVNFRITDKDDFHSSVSATSDRLNEIQNGKNPVYYDMKQTHPYGKKSRVSKKGIPYLIIPFRWASPNGKGTKRRWNNVIPQKNYETVIKGMLMSEVMPKGSKPRLEKNASGELIERASYTWKDRLKPDDAFDDRSVGMVRMKDVRGSTYFTFRVISAKSPQGTWLYWRDGTDAVDMLGALRRTVKDNVEKIIESGIRADIGNMF